MSFNQGSVGFTNKKEPAPAPPFSVAGANNGLSLDQETGTIAQLGQPVGYPGDPAALLSDRQIPGAFTITIPDGKLGIGLGTDIYLPTADQKLMVLSDQWTNEIRAACAFFRSMVTPSSNDILIDSIIPGSFSAHLVLTNGSFVGGPGSVIAAIKGNLVTQGANPDPAYKTTLQLNAIDGGWLPIGLQNIQRVAIIRAQRPDVSSAPTGDVNEVIGFLIESMDSVATLGNPDRYGIKQEGDDLNQFEGHIEALNSITARGTVANPYALEILAPTLGFNLRFYVDDSANVQMISSEAIAFVAGNGHDFFVAGVPKVEIRDAGLTANSCDLIVNDSNFGVVLRSPGGNNFRIVVDDAGAISTVPA